MEENNIVEEVVKPVEDTPDSKVVEGEPIMSEDPSKMSIPIQDAAMAGGIGSLFGGGVDYIEAFEKQTEIFKRFDHDINKLDDNIVAVNEDLENTKVELNNVKLFSRVLTWGIIIPDIIFVIAIILILIFK